jgi:hypothetical protein
MSPGVGVEPGARDERDQINRITESRQLRQAKRKQKERSPIMKPRKLRRGIAFASSLGAAAMSVTLLLGVGLAGTASAATAPPPFPGQAGAPVAGFGLYPNWLPTASGNDPVSNIDVSEGSDTTLFVMQTISDLYSQAGIAPFACSITAAANSDCQQPGGSVTNPNNTQSDETDNFSGTEELQGTNDVGSGNGQDELCGTANPHSPTENPASTVDYARSSKPVSLSTCPSGVELGFAKDSVVAVDFQAINPGLYGSPTGYTSQVDAACGVAGEYPSFAASNGALVCTSFPSAGIGPVADGWLPTDPTNCGTGGGPACSGTPFTDIDNTPVGGGTGATSVAYRLFCQHGTSATPNTSQITDWGQLTNLNAAGGPYLPGDGVPIGVPIRIIGINSGSGTVSTFYNFAQSGIGTPGAGEPATDCAGGSGTVSSNDVNVNAASGADPEANQGPPGTNFVQNPEVSLENDANQIGDFANANWPNDAADEATDIATSLYSMSYGAYGSNPNAEVASIESGTIPAGDPSTFTAKILTANGKSASVATERSNAYPMSRTLFNIYQSTTVKASVGGFLNWLCDSNSSIQKGTDHIDGGNFDTDLTNIINGQYGYSRNTDATSELPISAQTPADNVPGGGVNGTCDANVGIAAGGITAGSAVITLSAAPPASIQGGWKVSVPPSSSVSVAGDTVSSLGPGPDQITLNNPVATGTAGNPTPTNLYFPGQAPVLAVAVQGS